MNRLFPGSTRMVHCYLVFVGLLGVAIGLAELLVLPDQGRIRQRPDPVLFFVSEQNAVRAGGMLLLAAGVLALSAARLEIRLAAVLLAGVVLAAYQLTRLLFGISEPCHCLRGVGELLEMRPTGMAVLKYAVMAILVVPSARWLQWIRSTPQRTN